MRDPQLVTQQLPTDDDAGPFALGRALAADATALIAAGPLTFTGGVLGAVHERGLRVPGDLSVLGYTDSRVAALTTPPLTTIERPVREAGRVLADLLLHRLSEPSGPRVVQTLPSVLRWRDSCGPPPT